MKNHITESALLEYFLGESTNEERERIRQWSEECDENRRIFREAQQQYLRMRWGMEAQQVRVDYADISGRISTKKKNPRRLIAAISIPVAAAVATALLLFPNIGSEDIQMPDIVASESGAIIQLSDGVRHVIGMRDSVLTETDGTRLSVGGGEIAYHNGDNSRITADSRNTVTVPRGADLIKVYLSDGTVVVLNSDSRLKYPVVFTDDERRVDLNGEAYFLVAHNAQKPFIVESGEHSVIVLGTEFNVSGYDGEQVVTTLVEGRVAVQPRDNGRVVLSPGEQSRYAVIDGNLAVRSVDVADFVSWKDGQISVERIPFEQILMKLTRRFNVEFDLSDTGDMSDIVLTGSIPAHENFSTIISILEKAANVEFKPKRNGNIKVTRN